MYQLNTKEIDSVTGGYAGVSFLAALVLGSQGWGALSTISASTLSGIAVSLPQLIGLGYYANNGLRAGNLLSTFLGAVVGYGLSQMQSEL